LTIALGHAPSFPEQRFAFLWESRNLSPPAYHDGKYGLLALQKAEQRRTGCPFTFIGDWQNQVDQLLLQEEAKHHQVNEGELSEGSHASGTEILRCAQDDTKRSESITREE
jgi:hypothetical protein